VADRYCGRPAGMLLAVYIAAGAGWSAPRGRRRRRRAADLDGLCRLDGDLVVGGIAVGQAQVEVDDVQVKVGVDELYEQEGEARGESSQAGRPGGPGRQQPTANRPADAPEMP
jgi:hypothetical protein